MRKILILLLLFLTTSICLLKGENYFVATSGDDLAVGDSLHPFKTLKKALTVITPGDYVFIRGGIYSITAPIILNTKNGTSEAYMHVFAFQDELPILSYSLMAESSSNRGIVLDADYWHFKGIVIEEAGDNGMLLAGNNNIIENCIFRKNHDTGLQISRYSTSNATIGTWPANNLILNCESYDNSDSDHEDADGFAAKLTCGEGNTFRGCISHHNIDDGWDLYTKTETGPIGKVILEGCIAHNNGILTDGSTSGNGDKNGFKLGGEDIAVDHTVRRCIAFNNGKHGFTYNRNLGTITFSNNTSYNNAERNFNFDGGTSVFTNNLSYITGSDNRIIGTDNGHNAWENGDAVYTITTADFESLIQGINSDPVSGGFLNLATGSQFIDDGLAVEGILFNGLAPDIGAIETGGPVARSLEILIVGNGTVTPGSGLYPNGQEVNLTAVAALGWYFAGWEGDTISMENPISILMDTNKSISAVFLEYNAVEYTLSVSQMPTDGGTITLNPEGGIYEAGTIVEITAVPAEGYAFSSWSGDYAGSGITTEISVDSNINLQANFEPVLDVDITNLSLQLIFYPNPAENFLIVTFNNSEELLREIEIFDIYGRQVLINGKNLLSDKEITIDISELPSGFYAVRLKGCETYIYKRFVKK